MAFSLIRLARFSTLPVKNGQDISKLSAEILQTKDYFGVRKLFSVKDLFEARVHLGHKEGTLNDHMRPYIFGSRLGHLIFDLDKTAELLGDALNFVAHMAFRDGIILFLSRHRQTSFLVEKLARDSREFAHTRHWQISNITMEKYPEVQPPDLLVFLHTQDTVFSQHLGIVDAARLLIPTVAVVDTDCDPRIISYPIPGNDDSPSAVELYCRLFKQAVLLGKAEQSKVLKS